MDNQFPYNLASTLRLSNEDDRPEDDSAKKSILDPDDSSTRTLLRPQSTASQRNGSYLEPEPVIDEPEYALEEGHNLLRMRRKRSGTSTRYSSGSPSLSTFGGQYAVGRGGWWRQQMLVDRSFRFMAALMTVFALIMISICAAYFSDFINRANKNSTSVGGKTGESCKTMEGRNVAIHLLINIAATMILGMSNTYQQLVTSLKADEIRWVLSKRGDSRVGTNSPLAINHKKVGKTKAWLAWLLLISTSLPIHFLANSVIGPSFYVTPPRWPSYNASRVDSQSEMSDGSTIGDSYEDFGCWSAFRSGQYHFAQDLIYLSDDYYEADVPITFSSVSVTYDTKNCSRYVNDTTTAVSTTELITVNPDDEENYQTYGIGNCTVGESVGCIIGGNEEQTCRLNVRMQAAIILAGCLTIKAVYMVLINFIARGRTKAHCLTFGDVIVASALDPDLRIQNECMVNAGDGYRHLVGHTCHKHCKDPEPSITGDTIGHCQKCKKWNTVDKAADLPHPAIAIKYKKSLISNLGSTAVTQMIILMFCSICMLGISLFIAVAMGSMASDYKYVCANLNSPYADDYDISIDDCQRGLKAYLNENFGTFGGFNSSVALATLAPDSLSSEIAAFSISNGAQLLYSLLYLLLIYNITLISMEHDWGKFEEERKRPRCTLVRGRVFDQSYLLQLPKMILYPMMFFSSLMHWLLGQAISTRESIWADASFKVEHSQYTVVYAAYPIWMSTVCMLTMTGGCWWAFTYTREGFIPQMYGSIRACCASTTDLDDFPREGVMWGDLGISGKFRHAGFSASSIGKIIPAELYCGRGNLDSNAGGKSDADRVHDYPKEKIS